MTTTWGCGVLKAPVDARCKFSYSSWSALGRRGGAGPDLKGGVARRWTFVENGRRASWKQSIGVRGDDIVFNVCATCIRSSRRVIG